MDDDRISHYSINKRKDGLLPNLEISHLFLKLMTL